MNDNHTNMSIHMDHPLVSVLMSTYRDDNYLEKSIKSILNQTFRDFEFLIVNDGVGRLSRGILKAYSEKDDRICIIDNGRNRGLAASLNNGLARARGKYIARMDADDIALPQRLEIQIQYMESHPKCIVCGSNIRTFSERGRCSVVRYEEETEGIRLMAVLGSPFAHPSVMINRKLLERQNLKYSLESAAEDYDLWSRLVFNNQVHNIQIPLLLYRVHDNNLSKTNRTFIKDDTAEIRDRIFHNLVGTSGMTQNVLEGKTELEQTELVLCTLISREKIDLNSTKYFRKAMDAYYRWYGKRTDHFWPGKRYWSIFKEYYRQLTMRQYLSDRAYYGVKGFLFYIIVRLGFI